MTMDEQRSDIHLPVRRAEVDPRLGSVDPAEEQVRKPRGRWRMPSILFWIVILAIVAMAVWLHPSPGKGPQRGRMTTTGPVPVAIVPAEKGDMPITLTELGTVTPLATVTVKTRINGYLTEVAFQEGQMVKQDDFLAEIDPRPYQVALAQAESQLARDQALLKNAQLDLERYNTLAAQNSIANQTRDTQVSLVAQYQAAVKTDQAQIDAQKLNLTYCHIISPVTGRVGLRQVDPGNYVQTNDPNGIVVVTQLQPISVVFTIPEANLAEVMKRMRAGVTLPVTAYDRAATIELGKGRLETVDNRIDTTTGTVRLRAIFDNQQEILFPNQFVNVQLRVDTIHDTVIVPSAAIQRDASGIFVYVVNPDYTVAAQPVKLGPRSGQRAAILAGLRPGENVVVDGVDRLREGVEIALSTSADSKTGAAAEAVTPDHPNQQQRLGRGKGGGRGSGQGGGHGEGKGGGRQGITE